MVGNEQKKQFKEQRKQQLGQMRSQRRSDWWNKKVGWQKRSEEEWGTKFLIFIIGIGGLFGANLLPDTFRFIAIIIIIIIILIISYTAFIFKYGIIFIVVIVVIAWLFFYTPYGRQGILELERSNIVGQTEEELEEVGIQHQFRLIGEVLAGDFDPEDLWTSEAVKSAYAAPEDFEFIIEDVGPRKEVFGSSEELQIGGRINLISGFDKTTKVILGGQPDKLCTDTFKDRTRNWLNVEDSSCSTKEAWTCYISGSDLENEFEMERIYNRRFYCNHSGISVDKEEVISNVDVTWEYETSAVAGKQIYVFSPDVIGKYQDPLEQYNIGSDTLQSWYIGDSGVNLGIGLSQGEEYVEPEEDPFSLGEEGKFGAVNYLGITVENRGGGTITGIESLSVSFPADNGIIVADQIKNMETGEDIFIGPTTEIIRIRGQEIVTMKFSLAASEIKSQDSISPSDHANYYIAFVVDDDYIGDSAFRSFLVKTELRYKYRDSKSTTLTVEP
jgi:hypothetical protein